MIARWVVCFMTIVLACQAQAEDRSPPNYLTTLDRPAISIIIDDMGERHALGLHAVRMPARLTYSFLPHSPYARSLATLAHRLGKEVMLHIPMETQDRRRLGHGGLRPGMTRQDFIVSILNGLGSVPYVRGINNHMGSLLTQDPTAMSWLMEEIARQGNLYFVDSRTTRYTVAQQVANEFRVPGISRNVFLDNVLDPRAIEREFRRLLTIARQEGVALAIGHPHPQTLAFLDEALPLLEERGIVLLPVSELIERAQWLKGHRPAPLLVKRSLETGVVNIEN